MAVNVEMSFEKARQQMAQWRNYAKPLEKEEVDLEPPASPNVLVDAVSLGGPSGAGLKPLVRHVIVKDLHKIGTRLKYTFPKNGVFSNKAPMAVYALFDGQSCAGEPGPMAAEFCARNFHTKLLERLTTLTSIAVGPDKAAVEAALKGTVEDLDAELLMNQPDVKDGCGGAVALLIGQHIFTAVLGRCRAVLCEALAIGWAPLPLGGGQSQVDADLRRLRSLGATIVPTPSGLCIQHPSGALSCVSRALGDRDWKGTAMPGGKGLVLVTRTPEVVSVALKGADDHPLLLLVASSVAAALSPSELVAIACDFQVQPRATCGEIAARALEARVGASPSSCSEQCTAVEICFLPERKGKEDKRPGSSNPASMPPAAKKAKVVTLAPGGGTQSVRLRHILLKYSDAPVVAKEPDALKSSADAGDKTKKVVRSRQDAETILRRAIGELRAELKACKRPPRDATEVVNATSKRFMELCKEHSECDTARKPGSTCGDLGWVTPEDRGRMGGTFKELVDVLMPGQLSDIAVSEQGLHLVQRIA